VGEYIRLPLETGKSYTILSVPAKETKTKWMNVDE
jgi:hypothetical protein